MSAFILKTGPAEEPVSLSEAKNHLRVTESDEDALILGLIRAAREQVEADTGRPLLSQTWQLVVDNFSGDLELKPGTVSIVSVKYQGTDNVEQTLADTVYELRERGLVPSLALQYDQTWPDVLSHPNSVTIEFTAGYSEPDFVPQPIKQAMLLLISHLYENREVAAGIKLELVPMAYDCLLSSYRIPVVG